MFLGQDALERIKMRNDPLYVSSVVPESTKTQNSAIDATLSPTAVDLLDPKKQKQE